jgi:hypothetical protein
MLRGLLVYTAIGRCGLHLSAQTSQVHSTEPLHNVSTKRGFALIQFTQDMLEKVLKSEVRVRKVSFTSKMYYRLCSTYKQLNIVLGLYSCLSQDVVLHVLHISDVTQLVPSKLKGFISFLFAP